MGSYLTVLKQTKWDSLFTQCLNLTPLEERLISPCIPFVQIRELPRGGQLSIHGNFVNVPADVNSTVSTLPRSID